MDVDTKTLLLYGLAAVATISWLRSREKSPVPVLTGTKGVVSSYLASFRLIRHAQDVVHQGYIQQRHSVFRVPTIFRWTYVVTSPQQIAEVAAAPENVLSFNLGVADALQTEWTMGAEIASNPYHALAIRGSLTRNLGRCFPQVRDEIVNAFDEVLALKDNEWKLIGAVPTTMQVVARTSNRLFVGLPLCRVQEYLDLNVTYTISVFARGQIIGLFPAFLKPIVSPLISSRKSSIRHAVKFLGPMIDERLEKERVHGRDWPDRPNDLLSWLLDLAPEGEEHTTPALARRILITNMAAIHTTSMTLTSVLYDLTANPEYIVPLREEAERVIEEAGWTKAALGSLHKIDSFIRESQRLSGSGPLGMSRQVAAKEGFTFSDGTHIPYGGFLNVPTHAVNSDPAFYEHADKFEGFRFSRLRPGLMDHDAPEVIESEGPTFFNRQMVSTAQDHLVFGHGHHACPGRFFAATELKAMLAHILINYDVKAETAGVKPQDEFFSFMRMPNTQGKIYIRKRQY